MKICSDFVTIRFYFIFYIFFFVNWLAIKSCFRNIADISPYFMFFPKNSSFVVKKDMDLLKHGTQRLNYLTVFVADEILNLFYHNQTGQILLSYQYLHCLCWVDFWKNELLEWAFGISTSFVLIGLLEEWNFCFSIST